MAGPTFIPVPVDQFGRPIASAGQPETVIDPQQAAFDAYSQRTEGKMLAPPPDPNPGVDWSARKAGEAGAQAALKDASDAEKYAKFRAGAARADAAIKNTGDAFAQARADNPLLDWGTAAIQAPTVGMGAVGMGAKALSNAFTPSKSLPMPTGTPTAQQAGSAVGAAYGVGMPPAQPPGPTQSAPGVDVSSLPAAPRFYGGMAPGGGAGLGSDKALQGAQQDQISGQQAQVEHAMEGGAAQVNEANAGVEVQGKIAEAKRVQVEAEKQASDETTAEQEKYDTLTAQARDEAAKKGVDPGRQFRDRGAAFNVMMAIGGAVSGMLSGLTGQPNAFVQTLKDITDNDIKAQQTDIDQSWKKVSGMETTYQNLVRRGVDKRMAAGKYYEGILNSTEADLKARLMKEHVPVLRANIEASIQQIQNERSAMDVHYQEYWKALYDRRTAAAASAIAAERERVWRHNMELGEFGIKKYSAETQRMDVEGKSDKAGGETAKDLNARFVKTGRDALGQADEGYLAPSAEEGKQIHKAAVANKKLLALAQEAQTHQAALHKQYQFVAAAGAGVPNPAAIALIQQTSADAKALQRIGVSMQMAMKDIDEAGALDNGVVKAYSPLVGNLDSPFPDAANKLKDAAARAEANNKNYEETLGTQKAVRVVGKDGVARVVPVAQLAAPVRSNEDIGGLGRPLGQK